jgi:hypothetical protein
MVACYAGSDRITSRRPIPRADEKHLSREVAALGLFQNCLLPSAPHSGTIAKGSGNATSPGRRFIGHISLPRHFILAERTHGALLYRIASASSRYREAIMLERFATYSSVR